ncbi:MAG: PadR family transcriptional regulator [Elusimicrobiota bacterium]|nr:PadR family transcriptional regulator [Elusimicrobiota bacterium]
MEDLMFLGLLQEGPKHGYEIKKEINSVVSQFTGITLKSVYYPLKKLEEKGMVSKSVGRAGKRPEKYIYKVTKKGKEEFTKLLNNNFLIIQRPYLNIDLSLYFLQYGNPKIVKRRLENRLNGLKGIKRWAENREKTLQKEKALYHMIAITEHSLETVKYEIRFTERLIKQFA